MPETGAPLLEVSDLAVDFAHPQGLFNAVRGVSFVVDEHESLAIIGESGSGKSVTAKAILGLIDSPPGFIRSGDVRFRGQSIFAMSRAERQKLYGRCISVVFQDPLAHFNPVYTVGWQVAEVCRIHGASRADAEARAIDLLDQVGIPDARRRYQEYPHQFSGGQRQRIMIAMAMALQPDVLIADEPTTALDVTVQAQILDLLRRIQAETGTALIMITHDLGVAADIAKRVVVMRRGEIVERGGLKEVFDRPSHPYTRELLSSRTGQLQGKAAATAEGPLLSVENLVVQYGSVRAVQRVDLSVRRGEVLGIVGESGSGKSSVAGAILGLCQPSGGVIRYRSRDVADFGRADLKRYRRSVQAVFQDPYSSLNPRMTVERIISEPWVIHPDVLPKERWRARATELLESVGMSATDLDKYPSEFSGGQLQRIAIARALALNPELVICDEAVSSLDMSVQAQVVALLAELRDRLGLALVFITHDLHLVRNFADRILVMQHGRVVEAGPTTDIFERPSEAYTRTLIAATPVPDPVAQAERRKAFKAITASPAVPASPEHQLRPADNRPRAASDVAVLEPNYREVS